MTHVIIDLTPTRLYGNPEMQAPWRMPGKRKSHSKLKKREDLDKVSHKFTNERNEQAWKGPKLSNKSVTLVSTEVLTTTRSANFSQKHRILPELMEIFAKINP